MDVTETAAAMHAHSAAAVDAMTATTATMTAAVAAGERVGGPE
jgi:hypothetical protein